MAHRRIRSTALPPWTRHAPSRCRRVCICLVLATDPGESIRPTRPHPLRRFMNIQCALYSQSHLQIILVMKILGTFKACTVFQVILQIFSQILAYASSCINPVLYAFLSENFRKAFKKVSERETVYWAIKYGLILAHISISIVINGHLR